MTSLKRKIRAFALWIVLSLAAGVGVAVFQKYDCLLGVILFGAFIGIFIQKAWNAGEDIADTSDWKASQRKLLRGGIIKEDMIIRISFAYLYRIKVGNKYLLVKNARGTGKYQPVGGVYKLYGDERIYLNNSFHVVDDNKIPIDESSRDDYRLQMPCRYLRSFIKRFNSKQASRERIDNLGREFREELGEVLDWDTIRYRYCGQHITELKYSDHFQCYELLLADIVELIPTEQQKTELESLEKKKSTLYRLATAEEIKSLGIAPGTSKIVEWIADHSIKVLQENEQYLSGETGVGEIYEIKL